MSSKVIFLSTLGTFGLCKAVHLRTSSQQEKKPGLMHFGNLLDKDCLKQIVFDGWVSY